MERLSLKQESFEKPDVLFHASSKNDIRIFEPRAETVRSHEDGPVVFASSDKAYASAFLTKWDDSWVQLSRFGVITAIIISDQERYLKSDVGGTLYELPSNSFTKVSTEEELTEWKSPEKVKPTKSIRYESSLEAMIENGIQVYFVSSEEFEKITAAKDDGVSILQNLKSENQIRDKNVQTL